MNNIIILTNDGYSDTDKNKDNRIALNVNLITSVFENKSWTQINYNGSIGPESYHYLYVQEPFDVVMNKIEEALSTNRKKKNSI